MNTPKTTIKDLKQTILERIDSEHVIPQSRLAIGLRYGLFVGFAVSAILLGALAVATILFTSFNAGWEYYEMTHRNSVTFIFSFLPYIWIVLMAGMVVLAYVAIRKTKRGYRHSFISLLIVILVTSVVGGFVLHTYNIGQVLDKTAYILFPGQYMPADMRQRVVWHAPAEGRIMGMIASTSDVGLVVMDINEITWVIDPVVLNQYDWEMIVPETEVRILGVPHMDTKSMVGCMVLPGVTSERMTYDALRSRMTMLEMRVTEYSSMNTNNDPMPERKVAYVACQNLIAEMIRN